MTPGPPPKDRNARRRHNTPAGGEWIDLLPLEQPVARPLPPRGGEGEWSQRAQAHWDAWCRDPANTRWSSGDVAFAIDTLRLVDLFDRQPTGSLAGEIRLRMDTLGLTPKGKRNLRWRIAKPGEAVEQPAASSRSRSRRRLLAVDAEGGK